MGQASRALAVRRFDVRAVNRVILEALGLDGAEAAVGPAPAGSRARAARSGPHPQVGAQGDDAAGQAA
jgi:hypothetical protein